MSMQPQVSKVPPTLAGRFEVRGRIAADGFGEVFSAIDRKTGKSVSLRSVPPDV
jgi:hypothetical protein